MACYRSFPEGTGSLSNRRAHIFMRTGVMLGRLYRGSDVCWHIDFSSHFQSIYSSLIIARVILNLVFSSFSFKSLSVNLTGFATDTHTRENLHIHIIEVIILNSLIQSRGMQHQPKRKSNKKNKKIKTSYKTDSAIFLFNSCNSNLSITAVLLELYPKKSFWNLIEWT